ncbi:Phototropic-responsive NPH3 family protein isoform 1 [Hibiscus syriacus]|uniref:Phototropic-responsive NPH3 family protein isoform 1 n=1 Tax=Hibiscus syriacus TaxID=106335 RepID=A0A6A2YG09_HIBSY|nr:transcription factor bHLH143-like [Hibiscus syriacus]XP_039035100.1 transcription factor bHLH143-like [Hibiscus syriacus]KAE8672784.1 Phototropic-responsive NPH3 family protein isoform 1 [Hibiscus syriacus]
MVWTNDSSVFPQRSSWQLPDLRCMRSSLAPRQQECLPAYLNPGSHMLSASISKPGFLVPDTDHGSHLLPANITMPRPADISVLKTEQKYHPHEFIQQFYPGFPTSLPSSGSYLNEQQFKFTNGHGGRATANLVPGSSQKGLIIFDQSGSQTRLIYGPFQSPYQYAMTSTTEVASSLDFHVGQAVKTDSLIPTPPALQEEYDENHLGAEESEMHEDTEELNALLYSDEDDDAYGDEDDDEVTSTAHFPIGIKRNYEDQDHGYDVTEQVASSNGPNKRQKLLNDRNKRPIIVDEGYHEYDADADSSNAIGPNDGEKTLHDEQSIKDKIRTTIKILESIIPDAKGKNPLLVLDESIDYLNSLKLEVETLGVNCY